MQAEKNIHPFLIYFGDFPALCSCLIAACHWSLETVKMFRFIMPSSIFRLNFSYPAMVDGERNPSFDAM